MAKAISDTEMMQHAIDLIEIARCALAKAAVAGELMEVGDGERLSEVVRGHMDALEKVRAFLAEAIDGHLG